MTLTMKKNSFSFLSFEMHAVQTHIKTVIEMLTCVIRAHVKKLKTEILFQKLWRFNLQKIEN